VAGRERPGFFNGRSLQIAPNQEYQQQQKQQKRAQQEIAQ
jgi:hypothetical protein